MNPIDAPREQAPRSSGRRRLLLGILIILVAGSAGAAGVVYSAARTPEIEVLSAPPAPAAQAAVLPPAVLDSVSGAPESYADLVTRVAPSVATVRAERIVRQTVQQFPFMNDPFFRRFFGDEFDPRRTPPQRFREGGLGSGVIVSADGYILTNHHVIDGAQQIKIELPDRRVFDAKVVGSDAPSDLAVLKIDAKDLPALPLGDSDSVRVGDVVLAFGNPLGVGQTATMGIISAKGRQTGLSDGSFEDFIQTDAPINQGNSGGALVNTRGELIGVNSQIMSPSGGSVGIGFAIPSRMASNVLDQLIEHGAVHRGLLGVTVQTVTSDLAAGFGLSDVEGALVSSVTNDSPAERAGVRRGDVIVGFEGTPVRDANALRNMVAESSPGSKAALTLLRDGKRREVPVTLGELKLASGEDQPAGASRADEERLGLAVRPLTPDDARELGVEGTHGVLVEEVDPAGVAADAGVRPGDVIEEVNHHAVRSAADIKSAMSKHRDRPAVLLLNRRGSTIYIAVEQRRDS